MRIGLAVLIDENLKDSLNRAKGIGIDVVQLQLWNMSYLTEEHAEKTKSMLQELQMECTSLWCGWSGPVSWTFDVGPTVLGLVPTTYRASRIQNLLDGAKYAKVLGATDVVTHIGFVPLDCHDRDYQDVVQAVKYIADELGKVGQNFVLETGQEPPVVLRRLMDDCKAENLYVNYDPANLMIYGNAHPVDGIDLLASRIRSVHVKDGTYPQNGYTMGQELPIGEGNIDFQSLVDKLKGIDYSGMLYIEHEIDVSKETRWKQIFTGKKHLQMILSN